MKIIKKQRQGEDIPHLRKLQKLPTLIQNILSILLLPMLLNKQQQLQIQKLGRIVSRRGVTRI